MRLGDIEAIPAHTGRARGRRLRIALIGDCAAPRATPANIVCSGQSAYVDGLARELAGAGHAVDIFTRRTAPGQRQLVEWNDSIRVIHVPAGPPCYLPREQVLAHLDAYARYVIRFMRRQPGHYDIAHANFFMAGMVARQLKEALGLPFVIAFHALGRRRRRAQAAPDPFTIARVRIESTLMRAADRIIAECPQDRTDMQQLYGACPSRIEVAPCGFAPGELWPLPMAEARHRLGVANHRFVVLQLGRMAPRKGVDTVIQGLAMLRHRHGIDAQLLVVGGDAGAAGGGAPGNGAVGADGGGPELARLRSLAADLGVAAHVRFAGPQPRSLLRDYYNAANVFASTPWYEPFGITPVEAMACARPVIGSEIGGIKSTVDDGVTGFLIPSRDPEALADRLARLHRHPELARAMGEAGRRRACEHYTWRQVAAQLAGIYADVLEESQPAIQPAILSNQGTRQA